MRIKDFENFIIDTFTKEKLEKVEGKNEYVFTNIGREDVSEVGYCTNLTIETAQEAVKNNVDLLHSSRTCQPFASCYALL